MARTTKPSHPHTDRPHGAARPPAADPREPATVERLRHEIDSGRSGDKVPARDPAAAALGSDDEAAGRPPDEATVASAQRQPAPNLAGDENRLLQNRVWWLLIALAAICIAALIAAVLVGR